MHNMLVQIMPESLDSIDTLPILALLSVFAVAVKIFHSFFSSPNDINKYPLINGRKGWSPFIAKQKAKFVTDAKDLIDHGLKTAGGAFRLQTDDGIQVVLAGKYADGLKSNPNLNFGKISAEDFHAHIPGFEPFRQGSSNDEIFHNAVRENLTHDLASLNRPLSEEAAVALQDHWTDNPEWHQIELKPTMLHIISQLSSRVFLGTELCRNPDWLRVTRDYTVDAIQAGQDLRVWPKTMRSWVHWFIPSCRRLRAHLAECKDLVNPVLEKRRLEKETRIAQDLKPKEYLDAMEWMEQAANGKPYDPAISQVMMAMAANFSGSDAMTQILFDLCGQPTLVQDLRKEIVEVIGESNWSKSTIYKLKLMDSVLKESQRIKPAAVAMMRRYALNDTTLPDGTLFPKGSKLMVSASDSWDDSIYPNAHEFDGYRFLRMRDAGDVANAQYVSTGSSVLGFGHGKQACPGRFFAANELKIALSHILLKYDFKLAPDTKPQTSTYGLFLQADSTARLMIRRVKEDIEL
ncbi:uncharacterized protein N7483_010736 [Penicillium malachiteum]|uniref:uncharacterized protein n=1 Tax=Penicillium malachiteum TaxID=1324776 RepID=UPI0025487D36|nr:uncharacterized protein N7483_010736 [Penicillium malachiteum]KAJ5713555.1 hypothetical protein N7483_010736 [Penicillium malachiteum]